MREMWIPIGVAGDNSEMPFGEIGDQDYIRTRPIL